MAESVKTLEPALLSSIQKLTAWVKDHDYSGYDTFDGLSARLLRPFTFNIPVLRIALQQGIRRFPFNLRPLAGVLPARASKAMGYFAKGFLRLYHSTGDRRWADEATSALEWLIDNPSLGYNGACWGNHFDYQSRSGFAPKGLPSVVWTALIGHAFLDGYDVLQDPRFREIAVRSCEHILHDLELMPAKGGVCIGYFPKQRVAVHNANVLGGSLLARVYAFTGTPAYRALAEQSIRYTVNCQRPDYSWYYGEASKLHWVDNFHTGYVLDAIKYYSDNTGDLSFIGTLNHGYEYWKRTFFLENGAPRYYDHKTLPLDIQCCSQAIDTFVFFSDRDPGAIEMAAKIAAWTIENMQDRSGYFYYRRYSRRLVNKTPTLHWGQATMLCALAGLHKAIVRR